MLMVRPYLCRNCHSEVDYTRGCMSCDGGNELQWDKQLRKNIKQNLKQKGQTGQRGQYVESY